MPVRHQLPQHSHFLRICFRLIALLIVICNIGGSVQLAMTASTSPILDPPAAESASDEFSSPDYASPPGRFFAIDTLTPEMTDLLSPASTDGYSPDLITSTRSDELIAEVRAEALRSVPLLDIPLDAEFQYLVFTKLCHSDSKLFCAIMAIAEKESQFIADLIGDDGKSFGIVQIQAIWHLARMAKYDITDPAQLLDPYLCLQVGIDYLEELMDRYQGSREITHYLFALYNAGPSQANKWWRQQGITSTIYSRHVMPNYETYLTAVTNRLTEVAALPFS